MPTSNTLRAYFETVDLAELAARQLKESFPNIKSVTIQYKNFPHIEHENTEKNFTEILNRDFALTPAISNQGYASFSLNNGAAPIAPMALNNRVLADHDTAHRNTYPESEQTTESCLLIKASSEDCNHIEHRLRSMGGQRISKH